jgi:membrane protein YdbS with pleckstrin-like domain
MAREATFLETSEGPVEVPAEVKRFMLPRETLVALVRRHPAVLIVSATQAVVGLLAAFILSATLLRSHPALIWIIWGLWGLLMLRLVWEVWNWAVDYFVITSKRILLTSGVFTRNVAMMPLSKVTDMSFRRNLAGRVLGFGEFVVESAGQDQALRSIDHVPYPEGLYVRICGWIFEEGGNADEGQKGGGGRSDAEVLLEEYPPVIEGSFEPPEDPVSDETDVLDDQR